MNTRRKFFARIAAGIAALALAPEIAFGVKLQQPALDIDEMINLLYKLKIRREMEAHCLGRYLSPEYIAWRNSVYQHERRS